MFDPGAQLAFQLHLENRDGERDTRFEGTETIRLVLEITNTAPGRVQLRFPTRRVFDFAVGDGDGNESILWTWSHNRIFGDTITDVVFEAGRTETVWVEWDQHRSDGNPLGSGDVPRVGLPARRIRRSAVRSGELSDRLNAARDGGGPPAATVRQGLKPHFLLFASTASTVGFSFSSCGQTSKSSMCSMIL